MATSPLPIKNQLLTSLINKEYQHLLPYLQHVEMPLGETIYSEGRTIDDVYFPENCVVSLLSTLENGATTEVGLVGKEGMVGLTVFLGGAITPERALVQLGGTAMKMKASVLRNELQVGSSLQLLLFRYTRAFLALMSQSIACSQHHLLDQRFARWLLMMHDYSDSDTLVDSRNGGQHDRHSPRGRDRGNNETSGSGIDYDIPRRGHDTGSRRPGTARLRVLWEYPRRIPALVQ